MKEEFDFDKVGKQMPYQVPDGFFKDITQATLAEAKRREQPEPARTALLPLWKVLSVAASVAVLLVAAYFLTARQTEQSARPMATVTHQPAVSRPATVAQKEENAPQELAHAPQEKHQPQAIAKVSSAKKEKQLNKTPKPMAPETLDNLLASLSDEELQQLALAAEAEEYVYGETLTYE